MAHRITNVVLALMLEYEVAEIPLMLKVAPLGLFTHELTVERYMSGTRAPRYGRPMPNSAVANVRAPAVAPLTSLVRVC